MTLRMFIHPRRHNVTEPRHQPLPCPYLFDSMALGFLSTIQVVLKRSKLWLNFTLLGCLRVGMVICCSVIPLFASNRLTAVMTLTTKIDTGWVWSSIPVENNSSTSHTNIKFPRLGYHKSSPGIDKDTPHGSSECFCRSGNLNLTYNLVNWQCCSLSLFKKWSIPPTCSSIPQPEARQVPFLIQSLGEFPSDGSMGGLSSCFIVFRANRRCIQAKLCRLPSSSKSSTTSAVTSHIKQEFG